MSRAQQYEYMVSTANAYSYARRKPMVQAIYRKVVRAHVCEGRVFMLDCVHPDGSVFYEYVPGSKKEFDY